MVEDGQPETSPDELEVLEMFRVDARGRVDLQSVVVVRRVLEEAVRGVEHLVRQEEEPFPEQGPKSASPCAPDLQRTLAPRHASIVQPILTLKLDHQPLPQIIRLQPHNRRKAVLKHPPPPYPHVAFAVRHDPHRRLAPEIHHLAPIVALVLRRVRVHRRREARVVPRRRARRVVHEVHPPRRRHAHLPAGRQRAHLRRAPLHPRRRRERALDARPPRVVPRRRARVVVHEVWPPVRRAPLLPPERQRHVRVRPVRIRLVREHRRLGRGALLRRRRRRHRS